MRASTIHLLAGRRDLGELRPKRQPPPSITSRLRTLARYCDDILIDCASARSVTGLRWAPVVAWVSNHATVKGADQLVAREAGARLSAWRNAISCRKRCSADIKTEAAGISKPSAMTAFRRTSGTLARRLKRET